MKDGDDKFGEVTNDGLMGVVEDGSNLWPAMVTGDGVLEVVVGEVVPDSFKEGWFVSHLRVVFGARAIQLLHDKGGERFERGPIFE